jgi:hypothetical protein
MDQFAFRSVPGGIALRKSDPSLQSNIAKVQLRDVQASNRQLLPRRLSLTNRKCSTGLTFEHKIDLVVTIDSNNSIHRL